MKDSLKFSEGLIEPFDLSKCSQCLKCKFNRCKFKELTGVSYQKYTFQLKPGYKIANKREIVKS